MAKFLLEVLYGILLEFSCVILLILFIKLAFGILKMLFFMQPQVLVI